MIRFNAPPRFFQKPNHMKTYNPKLEEIADPNNGEALHQFLIDAYNLGMTHEEVALTIRMALTYARSEGYLAALKTSKMEAA